MPYDYIDLNLRRNRIPYFKLADKQKEKKKLRKKFTQFNSFLKTMGIKLDKIEIGPDDGTDNFKMLIHKNRVDQTESTKAIVQI